MEPPVHLTPMTRDVKVVAGFRWHKDAKDERVGSLLLGLYDSRGQLQHVGVTSAFSMAARKELVEELAPR